MFLAKKPPAANRDRTAPSIALALLLLLLSLFCAPGPLRAAGTKGARAHNLGRHRMTLYWIVVEADSRYGRARATVPILDLHGNVLGRVTSLFKRDLDMEGSGRLKDGRTVNFHRKIGGTKRYMVTSAAYGLAADGSPLVPMRSVAADRSLIPAGTRLYIPALKGVQLPWGGRHDGIVVAHDTGSAIKGRRLDLFVGYEKDRGLVERKLCRPKGVKVYRLAR